MHPLQPYDFQKDLLIHMATDHRDTLIRSARGMGVSVMMCVHALWRSLRNFDHNTIMLAPNNSSVSMLLYELRQLHTHMRPQYKLGMRYLTRQQALEFENGSTITLTSSPNPMVTQGVPTHCIMVDTANQCGNQALYNILMYRSRSSRVKVIMGMCGPTDRDHFLHHHEPHTFLVNHREVLLPWHLHPHRNEDWASWTRDVYGPALFNSQYGLP